MARRSSERKERPPMLGGEIVIECSWGHRLGRVFSYDLTAIDGPGWKHPLLEVQKHPLTMSCARCIAEGRNPDLRGSWAKVKKLATELERVKVQDPTVKYVLGGA